MKIAFMTAWNTTSGVAMHAEPIVKAMIGMGHEIIIFSFIPTDCHGVFGTAEDEDFVIRCFGTRRGTNFLDPRPFLDNDFDILVVEDLNMLPVEKLFNIFPRIQKKAKIMHVLHENKASNHSWFYKFDWDKVVYFDHWQDFILKAYPDAIMIPFPCYNIRRGDKTVARKKLGLPSDKNVIYSFGHRGYDLYYRDLPDELKDNSILMHVAEHDEQLQEEATPEKWRTVMKEKVITTEKFDDYLFASDAVIFNKYRKHFDAVVSSTVYQSLGAGCPIFVPKYSDFFHTFKDELIYYTDTAELNKQLVELLNNKKLRDDLIARADKYVKKDSPKVIAQAFLDLFKKMLKN
ncbi:MAG: hypothetical protein KKH98_04695 [Spirochaetes bacterium]|nr:hypothetical protein [Spirochaetota bacterium]